MLSEKIILALNEVRDEYIMDAGNTLFREKDARHKAGKILRFMLLAAIIASLLTVSAFALESYISSPAQAVKAARQELYKWVELGLLSPELVIEGEPEFVMELEEENGSRYFFERLFTRRYVVRWYGDGKYGVDLDIDTAKAKITRISIEAIADEEDIPIEGPELEINDKTYYWYNNFDDIFPPDTTVDDFCSALTEYWGFEGYTLSGTKDNFYELDEPVPPGDMLLIDTVKPNYYLTVYFEGDQEGVPMYIQLAHFPGYVSLLVGTHHLIG